MEPIRLTEEQLLDLYKVHIDEVRFQTKFNWDRTQYFLILNIGLIGVAASIWKTDISLSSLYLIALLFICGSFICILSIAAIKQGHRYYRRAVLQKSKVEVLLGFHAVFSPGSPLAGHDITTTSTPGKEEAIKNLDNPSDYFSRPLFRRGQINWYLLGFLYVICFVNVGGLIMVTYQIIPQALEYL